MKRKNTFFLLAGLFMISFLVNSCKKEKPTYIPTLLTTGVWELGSLQEYHYVGDSQISIDTITCDTLQTFVFDPDMTCNYTNFNCTAGVVNGKWQLSDTKLYLISDITVAESGTNVQVQPFSNAHIINLGEFSLVLETGDIQTYYGPADVRTIRRYGFIKQRLPVSN